MIFFNHTTFETPKTEISLHNRSMEEEKLYYAAIFELDFTNIVSQACHQIMRQAVLLATQTWLYSRPWKDPMKFAMWRQNIKFYLTNKLTALKEDKVNTILTVTTVDGNIQLTFYPPSAKPPTMHFRVKSGCYFFTYDPSPIIARAATAAIASNAKLKLIKSKDPTIELLGDPRNLNNFLPDSGATQHMTPCLADLEDVVEGKKLGVEVADGHMIKCSITGNNKISMQDDNRKWLNAT